MQTLRKDIGRIVAKAAGLGPRQILGIISTENPDRMGDIVVAAGGDLKAYRRNNVVLGDHDRCVAIGNAEVEIKNNRVEALITFAPEGASEAADTYCSLVKSGVIKGLSIGFLPIEQEPLKGGGYKIKRWELLEISCCSIPANSEAVVLRRSLSGRGVFSASAKTTSRERRNAAVSALKRGAPSAAERAATGDRLKAKGVTPPSGDPAQYASDRVAEMEADARLRSALSYRKSTTHAQRMEELERLRR